jgi:hypothetical protein
VHLSEAAANTDSASRPEGSEGADDVVPAARERALCGRAHVGIATDCNLDLLGDDAGRLCKSCWRSVERWLSPPEAAEGEDEVVRWLTAVVLEVGEAMIEGVPLSRLEPIRRRVRSAQS